MTDLVGRATKGIMPKIVVKANRMGNQIRINLPGKLLEDMKWKKVSYFILEKHGSFAVTIKRAYIAGE